MTKMSGAGRGPGDYGCTLFEMIFLLTILASINTLVFVVARAKLKSARLQHTGALMEQRARLVRAGLPPYPWGATQQCEPQPASCRELVAWYGRARTRRLTTSDAWGSQLFVGCAQGPEGPRLAVYSSGPDRDLGTGDDLCRPLYPELGACGLPRQRRPAVPRVPAPANPAPAGWPRVVLAVVGTAIASLWLARRGARRLAAARCVALGAGL